MSHEKPLGPIAIVLLGAILLCGPILPLLNPLNLFLSVSYAVPGALLAIRRPRNVIGWLLVMIGVGYLYTSTSPTFDPVTLASGRAAPYDLAIAWVNGWAGPMVLSALLALIIVFPTGRLPTGRWHRPALAAIGAATAATVLPAVAPTIKVWVSETEQVAIPNPGAIFPDAPIWPVLPVDFGIPLVLGLLVAAVVSLVVRYRHATGVVRLQLRWLVAASAFLVLAVCGALAVAAAAGQSDLATVAFIPVELALPTVPIAVVVAVLRYRLLEIDRIISRTIAYVAITTALVAAYAGLVIVIGGPLAGVTGGDTISVALSTLVVAALFQPLRQRVQTIVDRRFDRARFDTDRTTAAFSERLRYEVDIVAVGADLQETVRDAIQPVRLGLWLRQAADR